MGLECAITRRRLAGQVASPLHDYLDDLAQAACAALSGTPATVRRTQASVARQGRMRLELVSKEGSVIGQGEATAEILTPSAPHSST